MKRLFLTHQMTNHITYHDGTYITLQVDGSKIISDTRSMAHSQKKLPIHSHVLMCKHGRGLFG